MLNERYNEYLFKKLDMSINILFFIVLVEVLVHKASEIGIQLKISVLKFLTRISYLWMNMLYFPV